MPPEFLDYSDDEKEREAKKEYQRKKTQTDGNNSNNNSNKRHKPTEFEEKMNRKNLLKTAEWNRKKKQNNQRQWLKQRPFNPFGYENNVFNSNYETAEINWATSSSQNSSGAAPQTPNNFNSSHLPSIYNVVPQFNSTTFIRPPRLSISPIFRHMPPSMNYQNNYPSGVHVPGFYPHLVTGNAPPNQNPTTSMPFSSNSPMNFTSPPPIAPPPNSSFNRAPTQPNSNQINNPMWSVYSFPAPPGT